MKVVLFCGGLGTRLREYSEQIPKPLVPIDGRPILWHIMKYYASFGHTEFILCLGYKGEVIREYFQTRERGSSGILPRELARADRSSIERDIRNWKITFVETGLHTNIGGRLLRVRKYLDGDEMFLANYADVLTDLNLNTMIADFSNTNAVAGFTCVTPPYSFHVVSMDEQGTVDGIAELKSSGLKMNGGYLALRNEIFDKLYEGEELVVEGFHRLIGEGRLYAHQFDGFWTCMDTFKEKQALDEMVREGNTPWQIWKELDRCEASFLTA